MTMPETTKYEIDPGYGFQEEMGVEDDHIQSGTFRMVIGILVILVVAVAFTVQWVRVEGQRARLANAEWEGPTAIREARAEATRLLTTYEVVDEDAGTYRIPIERAMELEVEDSGGQ